MYQICNQLTFLRKILLDSLVGLIQSFKRFWRVELRFLRRRNSSVDNSFNWCPRVPFVLPDGPAYQCPLTASIVMEANSMQYISKLLSLLVLLLWLNSDWGLGLGRKRERPAQRNKEEEQAGKRRVLTGGVDLTITQGSLCLGKEKKGQKLQRTLRVQRKER